MEYVSVEQAMPMRGLRLVLTAGQPGPWGEAAKALFRIKGVAFTAVRQDAGAPNEALKAWTGVCNAPVAVYNDEAPRSHWMDIIDLAERLGPGPALIPADIEARVRMFGLVREIAGERGFAWYRRIQMFQPMMSSADLRDLVAGLGARYGYSDAEAEIASVRCAEVLSTLSEQLLAQRRQGRRYFMGDELSALDVYWAAFSNMLKPLPSELAPIPEPTRRAYECSDKRLLDAATPELFELRDHIWRDVLGLPMDF